MFGPNVSTKNKEPLPSTDQRPFSFDTKTLPVLLNHLKNLQDFKTNRQITLKAIKKANEADLLRND